MFSVLFIIAYASGMVRDQNMTSYEQKAMMNVYSLWKKGKCWRQHHTNVIFIILVGFGVNPRSIGKAYLAMNGRIKNKVL